MINQIESGKLLQVKQKSKRKLLRINLQELRKNKNRNIRCYVPLDYDSTANQEVCARFSRLRKIDWIFPSIENYNYKAHRNSYDLMIVDISRKSMSIGIEIGRALDKKIPILMLNHESFTVPAYLDNVASYILIYEDEDDLLRKLSTLLCTHTVRTVSNEVEGVI